MTNQETTRSPSTPPSLDLLPHRIEGLRDLFPEAFAEGKVDFDRLRETLGDLVDDSPERYAFTWAGRRDAVRLLQTPSRATLVPCRDESLDFDRTQHLFIEGDNLEVLKLLKKPYYGRVKLIYIDPPYNTGNDRIYRDNYADPLAAYLQLTGQQDAEGNALTSNPETSGRYHSAWLSMMYPRLFLAHTLLTHDGVMFVSIDDHEIHNLRVLMDTGVFGEECFKNCIIFRRGIKSVQAQFDTVDSLTVGHEYVLMYAKSPRARFKKLYIPREKPRGGSWNNHWRGTDRPTMRYELFGTTPDTGQWRWSKERSLEAIAQYERMLQDLGIEDDQVTQEQIDDWYLQQLQATDADIDLLRLSTAGKPEHYVRPTDAKLGSDLWTDLTTRGSSELELLFGKAVFDNPKPVALVRRMVELITDPSEGDIVLDFFAGSCTTAQAVLDLNADDGGNRRFVCIQLQEPVDETTTAGRNAVELGLETIAEIGKERIRRVIARHMERETGQSQLDTTQTPQDLGFRVFKLAESSYRRWRGLDEAAPEVYQEEMQLYVDPLVDGWTPQCLIYQLALDEGYGLNCRIDLMDHVPGNTVFRVTDPDKEQFLYVCLDDSINLDDLAPLDLRKDHLFICRDIALDDEAAANLALQCDLKTI